MGGSLNLTRGLLLASSVFLVGVGLTALFFPGTVGSAFPMISDSSGSAFQLLAGGAIGFGLLNWVGRGAIYGGIYGRPIVVGNLGHGAIIGLVMLRWQLEPGSTGVGWVVAGAFLAYGSVFGAMLFRPPWKEGRPGVGD